MTTAIAILDDYQNVALEMADWSVLPADVEITVFDDHEADVTRLAERLADFDVVAIMRERTPFPRELIERLPHLRLLVTTAGATPRSTWRPRPSTASPSAAPAWAQGPRRNSPGA